MDFYKILFIRRENISKIETTTISYKGDERMDKNDKKPNGISWFALGFSIASLIAVLIK